MVGDDYKRGWEGEYEQRVRKTKGRKRTTGNKMKRQTKEGEREVMKDGSVKTKEVKQVEECKNQESGMEEGSKEEERVH